ncbi:hypothetical protein FRC09_015597 [Ceratobasidium sp. 395]|nr:hypothetical protein FRC09_015597 [Ceratobasidium sp. 395]
MAGAGFAGLLVILLGRLGMSVQEARRHCVAIMNEAFSEKKPFGNEAFKRTKLKAAVERMLESCGVGTSERMLDPEAGKPEKCKVVVCVAPETGMRAGSPTCLRTYTTDASSLPDCTIVEAICSSFAVSGLFKPMDVAEPGGITSTYIGLSSFNPMVQLLDEAARLFRDERLACVVSIGASQRQISANECERVAQEMLVRFMNRPGHYFRLSVNQGMENIKAIDWERRSEGTAHARTYLSVAENDAILAGIAHAVLKKNEGVPTMHLRGSIPEASSATHTIKLCPPPSPLFVGRSDLLSRIGQCLGDVQGQHICVVHGLGGVGKTQVALNYAHIFYVDCTSKHTIDADLKRIALAKHVGDCTSDALVWLARLQERWLIVYNNADDISINLRGYFPSCSHGSILITTRNRGMTNLARGVDAGCYVSNMSEGDATELFAKAAGMAEDIGAAGAALVEMLGRFPLAIVQAGSYIQTNMCTVQEYLHMYQTSRGQILEDYASEVQKADDYELTVYATWQVSYRRLSPLAKQLHDHLAFMHHDQITEDIFRFAVRGRKYEPHALPPTDEEIRIEETMTQFLANFTRLADGTWDKAVFLRTVKDLTSYSLLTHDEANRSYSIHPLVQQWTRIVVSDPDTVRSCVAFLLASSVIWQYETEDYVHRRGLLGHVDCLPDSERLKPRLAWRLHRVYGESGRMKDKERLAKAEHEANINVLGRENPYTLDSMGSLADAYLKQGRWGEAEVLLQETVEVWRRVSGDEHPETLAMMGVLAETYRSQGKWGEAEALQQEVLEVTKRVRGDEHPYTLTAVGGLALVYSSQGRWGEAEVLQQELLEVRKRVSGNEHPDTLRAMGNLAATYSSQGRWGEGEALQRKVLEVEKRVSGNKHPNTLLAMGNLAETYRNQGRWGEAEVLQQEVVGTRKQESGDEHPFTLTAMANLALVYWSQGRWEESKVLLREVVDVGKRAWGNEHPDTLKVMGCLALAYTGQERWGEAEVLLRDVVEVGKRVWGNEHPNTLTTMGNLASVYSGQGKWGEVEVLLRDIVDVGKRKSGNEHPATLTAMEKLVVFYSSQGRWGEAEEMQQELVEVKKRLSGDEHSETLALAMENLALVYLSQGKWGEAEVLLREVVETGKRVWGNEHPHTLGCWIRWLERIRRHLAESNRPTATSPAETDTSARLLEVQHLDTAQAAETSDSVQSKPEGTMPVAVYNRRLMFWPLLVGLSLDSELGLFDCDDDYYYFLLLISLVIDDDGRPALGPPPPAPSPPPAQPTSSYIYPVQSLLSGIQPAPGADESNALVSPRRDAQMRTERQAQQPPPTPKSALPDLGAQRGRSPQGALGISQSLQDESVFSAPIPAKPEARSPAFFSRQLASGYPLARRRSAAADNPNSFPIQQRVENGGEPQPIEQVTTQGPPSPEAFRHHPTEGRDGFRRLLHSPAS